MRRKLAAGNWKMNGSIDMVCELEAIANVSTQQTDVLLCLPATHIRWAHDCSVGTGLFVGGQDCHTDPNGAHTGDISAEMIRDCCGRFVIVGHSERRADHGESNADVNAKARAAWRAGLTAVICLGESLEERQSGGTLDVIGTQLAGSLPNEATSKNTVIAYEPIWAIGTGLVPEMPQIAEVHDFLRAELKKRMTEVEGNNVRILYGGSVKPDNAAQIFSVPNVDGALVGGASLKANDFKAIVDALDAS